MRTVLAGALALTAGVVCAQITVADEVGLTVHPAESVPFAYSRQLLVRFDLGRARNAEKIRKATLSLSGSSPLPVAVEVRPITTQWGGATPEFVKREREGVWRKQDLERHGYEVCRDLFRLGDPIGEWASLEAKKWPARWAGESVATIGPGGAADVTALVKRWVAEPGKNFGVLLKLAAEAKDAYLGRHAVSLRLEGDGLTLAETIRLSDPPAWLPKGYRVQHPRLPYPTKQWLAALKADPKRLAAVCASADSFNPAKGRASKLRDLALAQTLTPTAERAALISKAIDAPFPNHGNYAKLYGLAVLYDWGYDLLAPADRRRLAARIERMCTGEEMGSS